jgi:hypothetical protein
MIPLFLSACDIDRTFPDWTRDQVMRMKYGEPPPCRMELPQVDPATWRAGEHVGAWCVDERRGMIDGIEFLDGRHLLVASSRDGLAVVDLGDGSVTTWDGPREARVTTLLSSGLVAVGYNGGTVEVRRPPRGEVVASAGGFGGVRVIVERDEDLFVLSNNGVRTRARLSDLDVVFRRTDEDSWCGEGLAGGAVWACTSGAIHQVGAIMDTAHLVSIPIRAPWGSTVGSDGRLWVVGDHRDGSDRDDRPAAGVVVLDPTDASSLRSVEMEWRGTLRDVATMPRGVAISTWSGRVYFVDDAGPFAILPSTGSRRAQTIAVSPDGWLPGGGPIVAVGQDFGQVDFYVAAD